MKNSPLVSVMITSYNQLESLKRAVQSVMDQTYDSIQMVIADDFSQDGSREYLLNLKESYPNSVKLVFQKKNVGITRNKNSGFKAADGEYITYLDGDDFYYPKKIENELNIFLKDLTLDIVYSNFSYVNLSGEKIKDWAPNNWCPHKGLIFKEVFSRDFPFSTLFRCELMKAEVLEEIDFYDVKIKAFHDWDSRIRMSEKFRIGYSNYIGSAYVDDPNGISKTEKRINLFKEMLYVIKKNKHLSRDKDQQTKDQILKLEKELMYKVFSLSLKSKKRWFGIKYLLKYPQEYKKTLSYIKKSFLEY